ncbi:hypothetical protein DD829_22330 [Chryseobacterium sp. HMWF035]|nr:hypothetical protein DD829_22330 [Chryseobacterium sp. HMWF035]
MNAKGYRVYNTPTVDWNINIIGIRNKSLQPKKFDDTLIIFHNFMEHWYINYYPITTDPSIHYLREPVNNNGTAILVEGQYLTTYSIDKHKGQYDALCQRLGNVKVYRDNDRNGNLDIDSIRIETGMFGINIHKGSLNGDWNSDNTQFSAGCQVFADVRHFQEFMLKCKNARAAFGNKFTYTLLNEIDFE